MQIYTTKKGEEVSTNDWNEVQAQDLWEPVPALGPMKFFYQVEFSAELNKEKNAQQCIQAAVEYIGSCFNPASDASKLVFSSDGDTHTIRHCDWLVDSRATWESAMLHLQSCLERDAAKVALQLRVMRLIDGVVREDWIFLLQHGPESVPAPKYETDLLSDVDDNKCQTMTASAEWGRPLVTKARGEQLFVTGPQKALRDLAPARAFLNSLFPNDIAAPVIVVVASVTPLYEKRANKLIPRMVRIVLAASESNCLVCNVQHHNIATQHIDVYGEQGRVMAICELSQQAHPVPHLGGGADCKDQFDFLKLFWGSNRWMEALNKTYTQLASGVISKRRINDQGQLEYVDQKARNIEEYLAGHKCILWGPNKKVPTKKARTETGQGDHSSSMTWIDPFTKLWKNSLERSKCKAAIFNPQLSKGVAGDWLNTYEGFGIEAKAPISGELNDAAPLLRAHILKVICNNDPVMEDYLLTCITQMVRFPWIKLGIVFVLKSKQGAGKNTLLDALNKIFGHHGLELNQARHITGNFNQHLANKICIILNEAVWGGNKQSEGTLKAAITDSNTIIEKKGVDAQSGRNYWNFFI